MPLQITSLPAAPSMESLPLPVVIVSLEPEPVTELLPPASVR